MHNKNNPQSQNLKKCPECLTHLPIDAKVCVACKKKVGEIDKYGMAKKPVDWLSYVECLLIWCAFCLYMWWAFFRDK